MLEFSTTGTDIVYTTDAGLALPTLVSISPLRRWCNAETLLVHVLTVGLSAAQVDEFKRLVAPFEVNLIAMDARPLAEFTNARFNKTHVPPSCLARLFLGDRIAAADTRRVLYVDGDTLFRESPEPLLSLAPSGDNLLLAEDQSFFYRHDTGPTGNAVRQYFQDIGIDGDKGYGNSGVILGTWGAWRRLADVALQFLRENLEICRFHDQSAINAVIGTRRVRLSASWNFLIPFRDWGVDAIAPPRLMHFAGAEKPWKGRLRSSAGYHRMYAGVLEGVMTNQFSKGEWSEEERRRLERIIQFQRIKNATILRNRRRMFAESEAAAVIPA